VSATELLLAYLRRRFFLVIVCHLSSLELMLLVKDVVYDVMTLGQPVVKIAVNAALYRVQDAR